jgi:porin
MHHKRAKRILAAACCACLLAGTARADEPGDAGAKKFELLCPPWQWDTATHEYMGIRPELGARGCTLDITLTADWAKNFMGGLNTEGYNFGHLLNASLSLDTEKLKLWKGGTFFLNFQNENGEFATADAGDIQVADNIDADGRTQISELWYGQKFFDDKLEIRVGKIDPNAEMGTSPISAEFINSSPGALPTILGMPLYPDPSTGALALFDQEHFYLDLGVFDGATQAGIATGDKGPATLFGSPSALFLIGEGGPKWTLKEGTLPGKLGVGVWHHTGRFDRFDGGTDGGASGFYFLFDQQLYRENPKSEDDDQGVGLFLRYGWADPDISLIEHSIVGGVACTGCIPTRDHDVMGIGVDCAILSSEDGAGVDKRSETSLEVGAG